MTGDRVAGKVALVTGAARGLGRACAVRLAAEGADIVAVDLCGPIAGVPYPPSTPEDLAETAAQVAKTDRRVETAVVDTRDLGALCSAVDGAVDRLGRLDVVVASAGVVIPAAWEHTTEEEFAQTLSVNVTGTWNTVMASAGHLVRGGAGGSIVLVSSAAGLRVQPFMVPYVTSKFALRGMAKAFAVELAGHGIRVNSLHPTGMRTGMGGGEMGERIGAAIAGQPRLGQMFANLLPVQITGPEEVAESVVFLASDESRYVTAHELAPDAGISEF